MSITLGVGFKPVMLGVVTLNVVMLNVIMLNVVAPLRASQMS